MWGEDRMVCEAKPHVVVSLTSYPGRIHFVAQTLESLCAQSVPADRILLWLAEEQFPDKEGQLPKELVKGALAGKYEIRWCDDLGSHKKYFYAMTEFPDSIVVTADDDLIYHRDWLKVLLESYQRYPDAVSATMVNLFLFDDGGVPQAPPNMLADFRLIHEPSLQLMAIGAGGILYPPGCLDERAFDKEAILRELAVGCTWASDDLWLKAHEVLRGCPVVLATNSVMKQEIPGSQTQSLGKLRAKNFHHASHFEAIHRLYCQNGKDELFERFGAALKASNYLKDDRKLRYDYVVDDMALRIASTKSGMGIHRVEKLPWFIHLAIGNINHQMSREGKEGTERECVHRLREHVLTIDGIEEMAANSFTLRALIEHEALLRRGMWGAFRTAEDYRQMRANWRTFLETHPDCGPEYVKGYDSFRRSMWSFYWGKTKGLLRRKLRLA